MKNLGKKILTGVLIAGGTLLSQSGLFASDSVIGGYWENWKAPINPVGSSNSNPAYYGIDINNFNHIYYSFLTLDQHPNADNPADKQWDGKAIYESMTAANVVDVMKKTDPEWKNPNNWQRVKIQALIDEAHNKGEKFIWAIGGWSDLKKTISDDQIPALVNQVVELLKEAGDGVDFDWEHLSENPEIAAQQRQVLGKLFPALRKALDDNGMSDKLIGYTTRFDGFWNTAPEGWAQFESNGEGIDVVNAIKASGSTFDKCVDWVNIMMYDAKPAEMGAKEGKNITLDNYKQVFNAFKNYVPKNKIVMGFEPGGQAAGGIWEGNNVDRQVIDYVKNNGYGGIMFWAVNQPAGIAGSDEVTGQNAQDLAGYANDKPDVTHTI